MGFLDVYLENSRLQQLSEDAKKRLKSLEKTLSDGMENSDFSFDTLLSEFGPNIVDMTDRLNEHFKNYKFSIWNVVSSVRFVYGISLESVQIINKMWDKFSKGIKTSEEQRKAKVSLGQELVYFVWKIWDPLNGVAVWLPFKKTLEKFAIKTIAKYAVEASLDFIDANEDIVTFVTASGKTKKSMYIIRKAF